MAAADDKFTYIKDLRPGMKNVTCLFVVIDRGTTNQTKDGSVVRKCRVADKTGSVCFSLWNEQAEAIEEGDILRLVRGYASLWKGVMMLYSGKWGQLEKVGEFTMVYSEVPDMSDSSHDFLQQNQKDAGDGRRGSHHSNRNGNNHNLSSPAGDRDQPPVAQGGSSKGGTHPPTDYRALMQTGTATRDPSPPRSSSSYLAHGPPMTHTHTNSHHHPSRYAVMGGSRGGNIHSHHSPARASLSRSESHRQHPYPVRR